MTAEEPTAIRDEDLAVGIALWHRYVDVLAPGGYRIHAACGAGLQHLAYTERVPLSQTATADRCRTCWPITKDVTP